MARKSESRVIDGITVYVTQHPATEGFELLTQLAGIFTPALGHLQGVTGESDISALGPLFTTLSARLGQTDMRGLVNDLFKHSQGQFKDETGQQALLSLATPDKRDLVFGSDLMAYMQALRFSLEVNFGDFLSRLLATAGGKAPLKAE